ncbi:MAG: AraC family transcriptional regulator [Bacteroidales bacterium]|nr:AraC family transcriptional regulator [Candidatus Colicola faecequi]
MNERVSNWENVLKSSLKINRLTEGVMTFTNTKIQLTPFPVRYDIPNILVVSKGDPAALKINGVLYRLKPPFMLVIPSGTYTEDVEFQGKLEYQQIMYDSTFLPLIKKADLAAIFARARISPLIKLDEPEMQLFKQYIADIEDVYLKEKSDRNDYLVARTECLFIHPRIAKVLHSREQKNEIVNQFYTLLDNHVNTKHQLEFYCSQLNISTKQLHDLLMNETGKSASEWISIMLMIKIKQQLATTRKSIKQIAYELQFSSPEHMNIFFRRKEGIPPSTFRKQMNEQLS